MYTTDVRPGMTAHQRRAIERFHRRNTHDEAGRPINYTASNGERPNVATPTNVHIHIHDGDDDSDPASETVVAARRPAMREPGLDPDSDTMADIQEQLAALNIAVATMAQGQGIGLPPNPDQMGEGEANQFPPSDPNELGDVVEQAAAQQIANSSDAGPPSPAEINEANRAMWSTLGRTTTGMGNHPPNSRAAEASNYQPNATNSISANRRMSTVARNDTMLGRTSGWGTATNDVARRVKAEDAAMFWHAQRQATNSAISKINRRNAAARQRAGWGV